MLISSFNQILKEKQLPSDKCRCFSQCKLDKYNQQQTTISLCVCECGVRIIWFEVKFLKENEKKKLFVGVKHREYKSQFFIILNT